MYILYTYISMCIFYIFKIYIFSIFLAYTKYIFLYLCILCIYFIHKIYISKNIYKIYLAILAVYNFLINGSSVVVFGIIILANINFLGKIQRKYQKSQKLTKFTLN